MNKPVILTGLRANSEFHLGNYLGAILPMVQLQKEHAGDSIIHMFVPDLHSFSTPIDHSRLYDQTMSNLMIFVAAGLDLHDDNINLYRQSRVPAHSELTWILNNFTYFGELSRMTQFKDKSRGDDSTNAGLFTYPVLMAADILLYGAEWVPVGEDQRQHLELTRDLAQRMNNKFERELFVIPKPWDEQLAFAQRTAGVRIRSLRDPLHKMSKSVDDPAGTILLSDAPAEAAKKIMSATTDSVGAINLDWDNQPGISNLLQIAALLASRPLEDVAAEWQGQSSYGDLKKHVAGLVEGFLTDLNEKLAAVEKDELLLKLETDEAVVNVIANERLYMVQQAVGLRPQD